MRRRKGNRGSAILMVVGLLTVLAMLGSAFLVVAYMDRQQSRAAAARSQADPAAEGLVTRLASAMARGQFYGAMGTSTYTTAEPGAPGWIRPIDAYNLVASADDPQAFLSAIFYSQMAAIGTVDTDGSGSGLANLYHTGLYNTLGDAYYLAAKVTDPSGLICVSTAGNIDPNDHSIQPRTPSAVGLSRLLGWTQYAGAGGVHQRRAGGYNLRFYDAYCGQRLLNTFDANCLPFSIGDEMCLRWLGPSPAPTETGRLWQALSPGTTSTLFRRFLTTYSVSRNRVPRPVRSTGTWPYDEDFTYRLNPDVSTAATRQATYKRVFLMLQRLGLGSSTDARKRMAGCFVANLMAYQKSGETDAPWTFTPIDPNGTAENFTAHGMIQRLVITEAYAGHKGDTGVAPAPPSNDWAWGAAVELYNPTSSVIDLHDYVLDANGTTWTAPVGTTVPAGGRLVVYNFQKGPARSALTPASVGFASTTGWVSCPSLSFLSNAMIRLYRHYIVGAGSSDVPVDQVSAADLNYGAYASETSFEPLLTKSFNIRRDDNPDRARYNIAAYERFDSAGAPLAHTLGAANGLATTPNIDTVALCGAPIDRSQTALYDVGELGLLYLAANMLDAGNPVCFPVMMVNDPRLGTLLQASARSRGRLDTAPRNVNFGGYSPGSGSDYPDVPVGCLLSAFFSLLPGDTTRDMPPVRVYGLINVNTAPTAVLACLPFPSQISFAGGFVTVDPRVAAEYIAAYREKRAALDPNTGAVLKNYSSRAAVFSTNVGGLRGTAISTAANDLFYLTPDEVAIPLADYVNRLLGWTTYLPGTGGGREPTLSGGLLLSQHREYILARDSLWRAVSNVLTVNTDVAVANVYVQMGNPRKYAWNYVVAIDRSNCNSATDQPAVILFSEVK